MAGVNDTKDQADNDHGGDSSSDFELEDEFEINVEKYREFFYEGPNRRRYYLNGEEVKFEEDQTHEFKGHQNISSEQIPPWCYSRENTSNRSRSASSRNLCGFLNTGMGGTVYVGILNDGTVVGARLTAYQQDHLLLSLHDTMGRFRPPVPRHLYHVRFVPVIDDMTNPPDERLPISEEARDRPHTLRTHVYCWCDLESFSRYFHGLIPMNFVVEITILPINPEDKWVRELDPASKVITLPVFQSEDAQIYMRKHTSLVKYSVHDIVELARDEVQVRKMEKLMEAWKQCLVAEKLYYALKKALKTRKEEAERKTSDDMAKICKQMEDLCVNKDNCEENVTN